MFEETRGEFPLTQWSLVGEAKAADAESRRNALATLLRRYIPALRAHLLSDRRIPDALIDDLLQGFIADKVVEQNLLAKAERSRGKFRTFLLVTLDRYVVSEHRKLAAAKRGPKQELLALDGSVEAGSSNDPAEQFNVAWARETIAEALRRMEAGCLAQSRPEVWEIFRARIVAPMFVGIEPLPYDQLVEKLGLATPLQACNLLTTAKRAFTRYLRTVAAEYSSDESEAQDEMNQLRELLVGLRAESAGRTRR